MMNSRVENVCVDISGHTATRSFPSNNTDDTDDTNLLRQAGIVGGEEAGCVRHLRLQCHVLSYQRIQRRGG